ncbi:hypothetical protein BVRB_7g179650 [Beta vulgaris subsp. vulgaris]|uniref:Uncharacterized protein n=1 Tax=Beta vulgaris subsp. vulgaris TaxID=3555 RepID=A0A0J8BAN7_BETVV|nr:hypothetical protein BVRB_7g179650 [Beta vulgaris subsp. vulgaris]
MISNSLSDKLLKEAFKQQKEIVDEENEEQNPAILNLSAVQLSLHDEEEDIDEFAGFYETQSQFNDYEVSISRKSKCK